MTLNEQFNAYDRLHYLILHKQTGTLKELAAKFNVSVGTIKNMLTVMRDRDFPIVYSREDKTYYYAYEIEAVTFQAKPKSSSEKNLSKFFHFFSSSQDSWLDDFHLCSKLTSNKKNPLLSFSPNHRGHIIIINKF